MERRYGGFFFPAHQSMSLKSLQTFSRNVAARKVLEDADAVRSLGTLFRIMFKWTKPEETLNASNLFFFLP